MVMGYICQEHGYVRDCDVDDSGERICRECGVAVTGLTGRARSTYRSPPTDSDHATGPIRWDVSGHSVNFTVNAFDFEDAVEAAIEEHDGDPQAIKEIRPSNHQYRA